MKFSQKRRDTFSKIEPWLYLSPFLIFIIIFTLYPVINVFTISFKENYSYLRGTFKAFNFENYKYVDGSYVKIESSIVNFTSGINLIYSVTLKNKLCFYTGCAFIAGLGWSNDRVTRQEDRFHEEKTLYNEYKGSYEFGLLPKIGSTYKF